MMPAAPGRANHAQDAHAAKRQRNAEQGPVEMVNDAPVYSHQSSLISRYSPRLLSFDGATDSIREGVSRRRVIGWAAHVRDALRRIQFEVFLHHRFDHRRGRAATVAR